MIRTCELLCIRIYCCGPYILTHYSSLTHHYTHLRVVTSMTSIDKYGALVHFRSLGYNIAPECNLYMLCRSTIVLYPYYLNMSLVSFFTINNCTGLPPLPIVYGWSGLSPPPNTTHHSCWVFCSCGLPFDMTRLVSIYFFNLMV